MPFYRFEDLKSYRFNPHLSTAEGPVIEGEFMDAQVGRKKQKVEAGDVIHVPRGVDYRWTVRKGGAVRYAAVRSTPRLEAAISKHGAADNWRG